MKMFGGHVWAAIVIEIVASTNGSAQTLVVLPDTSQTTTATATIGEQARVAVPAAITFAVTNIAVSTAAGTASVTVDHIVTTSATTQLKMSVLADAASFTPPVSGAATWSASDVTWNATSWTNAVGASGTLSHSVYMPIATCIADVRLCSTSGLVFTLGSKTTVKRAGTHTLIVRWKFESL